MRTHRRHLLIVAALAVGAAVLAAGAFAARSARPSAPVVQGLRIVSDPVAVFQLSAHEAGVAASRLRFWCALDAAPLRACAATYRVRLTPGRHVIHVRAVDPAGHVGPETRVVVVAQAVAPSVKVGSSPVNLAFGFGALWVSNNGDGTVSRIDPATSKVTATIKVGGGPGGVDVGVDAVWIANFGDGSVEKIDPATNAVSKRVVVGGQPVGVTASGSDIWIENFDGTVERLDAATGAVRAKINAGEKCNAGVVAFGLLWVANGDGTVVSIDRATNKLVGKPIAVAPDVDSIAATDAGLWVVTFDTGKGGLIDPTSRALTTTVQLPGIGGGITVAAGSVWASVYDHSEIVRIDPATGSIVAKLAVGSKPRQIVFAASSLWVVNEGSNSVTRLALP